MFNFKFSVFKRLDYFFLYVMMHWMWLDFYILYVLTVIEYFTNVCIVPLEYIRPNEVLLPYLFNLRWLLYCTNEYAAYIFWKYPIYWLFYMSIYALRSFCHESIDGIFSHGVKEIKFFNKYVITRDGCEMTVEYTFNYTLQMFLWTI